MTTLTESNNRNKKRPPEIIWGVDKNNKPFTSIKSNGRIFTKYSDSKIEITDDPREDIGYKDNDKNL